MKQSKIKGILYVFDKTPYEITKDTDADLIYVQPESLDGFKELNPSLTLTPFNYGVLQVTKPVWYDAYNAPEEEQEYDPEEMQPEEGDLYNIEMFENGDRGFAFVVDQEDPVLTVDRSEFEGKMHSIGASDDDLIDDLVGEYDSDYVPQATRGRKVKSVPTTSKIIVKKQLYGQYEFINNNNTILSIDYNDTESDASIDVANLNVQSGDTAIFGLLNKQPITKEPAGIYFSNQSQSIDIYDGTTSVEVSYVENPNDLDIEYSVDDPDLTLTDTGTAIEVSGLKVGSFTITASTDGNDYYLAGSATMTLVVTSEAPVDTRVSPELIFERSSYSFDLYTDGTTVSIILMNPHDIGENEITLNSDGLSYSIGGGQVPGKIEYDIVLSQTGTFNITASFAGDQDYLPETVYTTITVTDSTPAPQPIDYPVSLSESDIQIDQTSTAQDIHTAITNNLSGYSPNSWGVWPYITIVDQGTSDTLVNNVEMYSLSLESAISTALANVSYGTTVWQVIYNIAGTTYAGQEYNAFNDSCTFTFVQVQQDQQYGCSLLNNDIQFDINEVSDQDIEDAITGNLDGYDNSWMPEPTISVKYGLGDSDYVCQDVAMSQLDFSNEMSYAQVGGQWTVYYTIAADDYAGEHYAQQDLEFTISFIDSPTYEDYPVSLLDSIAEVEYEEGSSDANYVSAVSDALMGLLSGYDDTWMPTPICSIYAPDPEDPNEQVAITEDSEIGGSTFGDDLSAAFQESGAVVADQTQWSVYISIPASTYADDDYEQWDSNEVTLSFVSPAVEPLGHFRLTSNQNGSTVDLGTYQGEGHDNITLEYTVDEGVNWTEWDLTTISLDEGESVCFRGIQNVVTNNVFVLTGNFSASGNIMSLIVGDNYEGATFTSTNIGTGGCFRHLFNDCSALTDISELILPSNTANMCYVGMFRNCTGIQKAPYLPATTIASDGYAQMFQGCTNLQYVKFNASGSPSFYSWLSSVSATGILVNENPLFTGMGSNASGCPSGWTLLTSDPQNYDASIANSNIDIYPTGESVPYDDISSIVSDIQSNLICNTSGATASITIPDPNDQGGSAFVINNIELDNGPDLYDAIDTYRQNSGINIGDVWTATISIPQDTIDGQYYYAWQGTFTISFQDNP